MNQKTRLAMALAAAILFTGIPATANAAIVQAPFGGKTNDRESSIVQAPFGGKTNGQREAPRALNLHLRLN